MRYFIRAAAATAFAALMLSLSVVGTFAWGAPPPENYMVSGLAFSAKCSSVQELETALDCGASFISISGSLAVEEAVSKCDGKAYLILDAASIEAATKLLEENKSAFTSGTAMLRIKASASKVKAFSEANPTVKLIGYYKGNIVFLATSCIKKLSGTQAVQLQTGNPWGVQFNSFVMSRFEKYRCHAMISTADPSLAGDRPDNPQGWDDLISCGYSLIETAYPQDFAEYIEANTVAHAKLEAAVARCGSAELDGYSLNSRRSYESALKKANQLLDGSLCAVKDADNARNALNSAFAGLEKSGDAAQQGEFKITVGRVVAALFGTAIVIWGQAVTTRRRKKKTA